VTSFVDSSALVKRYMPELGGEVVERLLAPLVVSAVARVEVPRAVWRRHRDGSLGAADAATVLRAFDADWAEPGSPVLLPVAVSLRVLDMAGSLVARHPLRSLDAIQLASAMAARAALDSALRFVAYDERLRAAAATEGFVLLPAA
jgi:uncharacterized protein